MDLAQFKKVVESMGLGWSDRQVEDLFDALDRDGNGRIEVDEINGKGWFK
jgi:Ca2+-binding EF-hand superfamily protein